MFMNPHRARDILTPALLALAAALSSCAGAPSSPAPETQAMAVLMPRTVPYEDNATSDIIRADCNFATYLPQKIVEEAADDHRMTVQTTDDDLAAANQGRVLLIKIVFLHAQGGGRYTGAKSARIRGELRQDGKLIGDFTMQRNTSRGWAACVSLQADADALAEDVAKWLHAPQIGTVQNDD